MIDTEVGPIVITGSDIRPVVCDPLEQARSQTRMCSSRVSVPGGGNAGSSAQVAGPNSVDGSGEVAGLQAIARATIMTTARRTIPVTIRS